MAAAEAAASEAGAAAVTAVRLPGQPSEHALGLAAAARGDRLLLSVQGDGVITFTGLAVSGTRALGSSHAKLLAPVQLLGGSLVAALQPPGSAHGAVVSSPAGTKQQPNARPLLDAEQQVPLPGPLASLHVLGSSEAGQPGAAAVVLADGTVGVVDFQQLRIQECAAGSVPGIAPGTSRRGHAALQLAAASDGQLLAVARLPAQAAEAAVDVYALASGAGAGEAPRLQLCHSAALPCPTAGSRVAGLVAAGGMLALLWSQGGGVSVYHSQLQLRGSQPGHAALLALPAAVAGSSEAGGEGAPGRKRKAGAAAAGAQLLLAAPSEAHLLAVRVQRGGSAASYAVLDSRYGCCLAAGELQFELPAGAGAGGCAQLLATPQHSAAPAALLLGGCAFLLHAQLPRADLAGLVARLALPSTPPAAAQQPAGGHAAGGLVTAKAAIDLAAIAAAGSGACVLAALPPADAAAGAGSSGAVAGAAEQLAAAAGRQPLVAAVLREAATQLCSALQAQQQAGGAEQQQQQQQQPKQTGGRRARQDASAGQQAGLAGAGSVLVSHRLLAQGLAALAEVQEWRLLAQLHAAQPLQSLAACSGLLPALAAAQQHALLRQVLAASQDAPAGGLVQAMGLVLQAGGSEAARCAKQDAARSIRQAAAEVVDAAQSAVAAADPVTTAPCLAAARLAAAAVDGFSASELLLHALAAAPLDAVEAHAALRGLASGAVLRLLAYLAKWLAKFSAQGLDAAGSPGCWWFVSEQARGALAVPSQAQALAWAQALLDAQLARLALLPAAAPLLRRLAGLLGSEVRATQRLTRLKGVADHLAAGAPLPLSAEAASSEYTLELLDLRVAPPGSRP